MGRPVGSKNKKTLEREAAAAAAPEEGEAPESEVVPDSYAGEQSSRPEVVPEPEPVAEPDSGEQSSRPEPKPELPPPAPKRKPRAPKAPRPAERAPRVRAAPVAAPVAAPTVPDAPHFSLLDVIKQGLKHSKQQHKAERVARYDEFFAY